MNVLLLQGSLGQPARTASLVQAVAREIASQGHTAEIWDLRDLPLPWANPSYHHRLQSHPDPIVRAFANKAANADAFVLGSPVYHNSYSGVLKNALDHLNITLFDGKPVGLCGNGGRRGSPQACDHMRIVVRGLHGIASPAQVITRNKDFLWKNDAYMLQDQHTRERITHFTNQLVQLSGVLPLAKT